MTCLPANPLNPEAFPVSRYRATTLLSNGDRLVEKTGLAEKRALNIATLLRGLGVSRLVIDSKNEPEPGDGQTDPARRRVIESIRKTAAIHGKLTAG